MPLVDSTQNEGVARAIGKTVCGQYALTATVSFSLEAGPTAPANLSVTLGATGRLSWVQPAPNEAGIYTTFAAHPSVVTLAAQSSFTIVGFGFQTSTITATLAQNSSLKFTATLTNTGATPITGLAASVTPASGSGVTLTLDPTTLPATLAAGGSAVLGLTAAASPTASSSTLSLSIQESHGFTRTLSIAANVLPAQAFPSAQPQSFTMGILAGQSRTQSITLQNQGFDTWRGVYLSSPTLPWVQLQGQTQIGDIPPGGNATFSLLIQPPAGMTSGSFAQNPLVNVYSVNAATLPINAGITVTSSQQGELAFSVINADKPRSTSGQGVPVPGALATLTSLDVPGLTFSAAADQNGVAQFANLPSGRYAWTIKATGFQPSAGTMTLDPGLSQSLEVPMFTATVTYNWTVTPTSIQDQYLVNLSLTFKTDVPAPALFADPPIINLVSGHEQTTYAQYTLTNFGVVSAMNVAITPHTNDSGMEIQTPITTIPELKPGQSVVVPLKVTTHSSPCEQGDVGNQGFYTCAAGIPGQCNFVQVGVNAGTDCPGAPPPLLYGSAGQPIGFDGVYRTPVPAIPRFIPATPSPSCSNHVSIHVQETIKGAPQPRLIDVQGNNVTVSQAQAMADQVAAAAAGLSRNTGLDSAIASLKNFVSGFQQGGGFTAKTVATFGAEGQYRIDVEIYGKYPFTGS